MHLLWFHGIATGWLVGKLMKPGGYGLVGGRPLGPLGIVAGGLIGSLVAADHRAVVFAVSDPADQEGVASPSPPRSTRCPTGDAEHNRRASS